MTLTSLERGRRKDASRQAVAPCQLVHEVAQQERNLLLALPQGWHMHRECTQTVVEVLSQFPLGNRLFNVDLSSSQYPNIHLYPALATRPDKMSVPQDV